ncbi:hypothetical protein Tco_1089739 [Tanacetum coccineum]
MAPKKSTTPMTDAQLKALIAQGVADALVEIEANRSRNGDDSHDSVTGIRRQTHVARECTYNDFLKCQPLNFKGTEGVVGLTQWFKKMESIFHISNCTRRDQKAGDQNMEPEGQGNGCYELHIALPGIGTDVRKSVSRGVRSNAIAFATELMDQKIRTFAERQAKNKRKLDNDNLPRGKIWQGLILLGLNHGNQAEGTEARGMVYALGGGETNQDLDDMEDDINA